MIKTLNSLDKGGNIIDLTGAAADYPLAVGETATITYTSATSVPLHVATVEGVYELTLYGDLSTAVITNTPTRLNPNNTTVAVGDIEISKHYTGYSSGISPGSISVSGEQDTTTKTGFDIVHALGILVTATICTSVKSKVILCTAFQRNSATQFYTSYITLCWLDTTTAWTSLGTITFSFAQSGKIVIRRIA